MFKDYTHFWGVPAAAISVALRIVANSLLFFSFLFSKVVLCVGVWRADIVSPWSSAISKIVEKWLCCNGERAPILVEDLRSIGVAEVEDVVVFFAGISFWWCNWVICWLLSLLKKKENKMEIQFRQFWRFKTKNS